jgi:hypothetical protein
MKWIRDRWSLLLDAYSQHKWAFRIVFVICAVAGTSGYLMEVISRWIAFPQAGSIMILGLPAPLWGIVILCVFVSVVMLEYAVGLKRAVTPTIAVSFNPQGEGIIRTPTQVSMRDGKGNLIEVKDDEAVYVSVTVNALSKTTVKNCVGFITKIEKKVEGSFEDVPVYGFIQLNDDPRSVYPRVPTVLNFLKSGKADNTLDFAVPWPLRLGNAFKDHTTYRFTIEVNGDGVTETIRVEVDWTGQWDAIKARGAT